MQNSISGFITDKATGKALPDVNIFISGTNIGIASAQNGFYEIKNLPSGKQKLTFSLIGYEGLSAEFDIKESSSISYNAELLPRIYSTGTVEIKTERPLDRSAMIRSFSELLLGQTADSKSCIIENESVLQISRLSPTEVRFHSDSALVIINRSLGYRLEGPLAFFDMNTDKKNFSYSFQPKFSELKAKDSATAKRWELNRKMAYKGSLRHFLKSLYLGTTGKEGFQLYMIDAQNMVDLQSESNRPEPLKDLKYIVGERSSGEKVLFFDGVLLVRYGLDISSIVLKEPTITILSDGRTKEKYPFETSGSFYSRGLAKLLPEDFIPDNIERSVKSKARKDMHEMLSDFIDSLKQHKGRYYDTLKDSVLKLTYRHPDDTNYKLKYAAVLERCCIVSAENEYRDILETDSLCSEAYFRLGKIKSDEFNEYRTSVKKMEVPAYVYETIYGSDNQPDPSQMLGSLKSVSVDMFKEAESYLSKALLLNPYPEDYYLSLAFLYEDNGSYSKSIEVLKKMAQRYPDNMQVHLYLGMLFFKTSSYKNSRDEYDEALSLMSADEKNDFMFTSVKMLLEPAGVKGFEKLDDLTLSSLIKRFWESEDPLILTEYNERLLEHYSRVAYANLRFGNRKKTKPGWQSERGEILVRYGYPKSVIRYRPYVDFEYRLTTYSKTEVWYYGDMTFSFSDPFLTNEYALNSPFSAYVKSQMELDSKEFAGKLKKQMFDRYEFKPEGKLISGSFRVYQFKNYSEGQSKRTDLYLSLFIPETDSMGSKKDTTMWGLYCFDMRHNLLGSISDSLFDFKNENNLLAKGKATGCVKVHNISLYPGNTNMAGEILKSSDNSAYSSHQRILTKDFKSENSLMLSDILISPKVIFGSGNSSAINRSGIWLLPDPRQTFSKTDSVHIYYEIYNLGKNARGINDYQQDITITPKGEKGSSVFGQIISGAVRFFKSEKEANNSFSGTRLISHSKDHQMIFQTSFNTLDPGEYTLRIKLKDKITGQTTEAETEFSISQ